MPSMKEILARSNLALLGGEAKPAVKNPPVTNARVVVHAPKAVVHVVPNVVVHEETPKGRTGDRHAKSEARRAYKAAHEAKRRAEKRRAKTASGVA